MNTNWSRETRISAFSLRQKPEGNSSKSKAGLVPACLDGRFWGGAHRKQTSHPMVTHKFSLFCGMWVTQIEPPTYQLAADRRTRLCPTPNCWIWSVLNRWRRVDEMRAAAAAGAVYQFVAHSENWLQRFILSTSFHFIAVVHLPPQCSRCSIRYSLLLCPFRCINTFTIISFHCLFSLPSAWHCFLLLLKSTLRKKVLVRRFMS